MRLPALCFLALLAVASISSVARAAGSCQANHLAAQERRAEGKLLEAQRALTRCAVRECPALIDADCTRWLDEVNAELPTVVASARAPDGTDLRDVRLLSNGQTIAETLDGKPIAVDPGPQTFVFEAPGRKPVTVELVVKTGARSAPLVATFSDEPGTDSVALPPRTIASIALIGAGSAALVIFGGLAIAGEVQYGDLDDTCRPNCDPEAVDEVRAKFLGADISLGIGCAALASALIVYLAVPTPDPAAPPVSIRIAPTTGGAAVFVQRSW